MTNSKHTKGEWKIKNLASMPFSIECDNYEICNFDTDNPPTLSEERANAKLIAEAGTVANECGYTPRQLLEQRDELLEALIQMVRHFEGTFEPGSSAAEVAFTNAKKAIEKATR